MFCRSLFVLFLLVIVLSVVFRFTDSLLLFPIEILVITPVSVSSRIISAVVVYRRRTLVPCNDISKMNHIMKRKFIRRA
jgi:hypothetical protein